MDDLAEKGTADRRLSSHDVFAKEVYGVTAEGAVDEETGETIELNKRTSLALRIRAWTTKFGAEENGIEPIPSDLRTDQHPRDLFTFFASANMGTATLAFGTLGPALFGLGWWDSFLVLLFFNLIGSVPPALIATLGPKLGLRTMTIPRYSFGWWPAKAIALLNALNQIGWAMVNTIAGADLLYDVGQQKLPMSVSVLIIGLLSLVVPLFGYKYVHMYERYSWIVMLVCLCIVAGFTAKHVVISPMGVGAAETSDILSFGTAIIGFQISWGPIAADYGVYMQESTKPWKVFLWAWNGLFWTQFLIEVLGVALMTTVNSSVLFQDAYISAGVGGLCGQIFEGYGPGVRNFGYFIETILSFSVAAVVIANIYSLALNIQVISDGLMKVPRLIWSLIGGIVFLVAAVAGRDHLQEVMEDFLNVIAYWLTPFLAIMFLEHICFRRGYNYDVTAWNKPEKLPKGIAAILVFCIGTVLAVLSMSQVWWVGPIALGIGNAPYGTDISWELALGATIVLYIPLRWLEKKYFGL